MKNILIALILLSIGSIANATETITIPLELSEGCRNINIYKNIKADQVRKECSVEVANKTRSFFDVMKKCHPKLGMVSKKTCLHVTSNLKVLIPLFDQIAETANKPEYKLGLNEVIELEVLLNNKES